MGLSSTSEENTALLNMAVILDNPPLDWIILHLPDGRYAAFWKQGLGGENTTAVMRGDYTACAFSADTLEEVKEYIRQDYCNKYRNDRSGSYRAYIDDNYVDFIGWL